MKVAVSIPDPIFADAEALAQRLGTSRSEIYARALGEFVSHHAPDRVTQAMNEVIEMLGPEANSFREIAARQAFDRTDW